MVPTRSKPQSPHQKPKSVVAELRRLVHPPAVAERCDLCGLKLPAEHPHLVELATHRLACACQACAILFSNQGAAKYRRVPDRRRYLSDFRLDEVQWAGLMLPINLAYLFKGSVAGKILAIYPSPAGPTQSLLDFETWTEIVRENPILNEIEPDVEALLINRLGEPREYYLVPIDECYKLVGLIRTRWRGISGGPEVWGEIRQFFAGLKQRSTRVGSDGHA